MPINKVAKVAAKPSERRERASRAVTQEASGLPSFMPDGSDKEQPVMRRRQTRDSETDTETADEGRQFVQGLARGLEVLSVFRKGDAPLGNLELAQRTGMPKPTVSRIAFTLTQVGYLSYNARSSTYELGPAALSLGLVAQSNSSVQSVARPFLTKLAATGTATIGLGMRTRLKMLYVEAFEGHGLVGLRVTPGTHIPLATTALGRAYLAALPELERDKAMDEIKSATKGHWGGLKASIEGSIQEVADRGFCLVYGAWEADVCGVAAPIFPSDGKMPWAINAGGPTFVLPKEALQEVYGPKVASVARSISALLGGESSVPRRLSAEQKALAR